MDRRSFLRAGWQGGAAACLARLARAADSPEPGESSQPGAPAGSSRPSPASDDIRLENRDFRLILGADGKARSLVHKPTGQECLQPKSKRCTDASAFSITEYRPYNGEVHLVYPSKATVYQAASVRRVGDDLLVRFQMSNWVATVGVKVTDSYIGFILTRLDYEKGFGDNTQHPIDEFSLLQLPVRNRQFFGDWLNVMWDDDVAVNVLATGPHAKIDALKFRDYAILQATAVRGVKLTGVGTALITTGKEALLERIDRLERDFGLPLGVKSRRNQQIRRSYLWLGSVSPKEIDEYIAMARKAGFRGIQIYWPAIFKSLGHYPWRDEYPNGMADLQAIVRKIKEAGMIAGFHIQHPKASINDLYVSPVPDHRLNLVRMFTLAAPLGEQSSTITVEESPEGCELLTAVMWNKKQILKIGDELVEYASYTTEPPYEFRGCKRGALGSRSSAYPLGLKFGLLDIDGQAAVRFDQRTSIQREHAEKIAQLSNEAGFQFFSYDGAEDVHAPWWFWVSMSQFEVHKRLSPEPLFSTGAAKSHFGWHILTCSNEFDTFAPEVVKEAARKHQAAAGRYLAQNFTRTNMGWIDYVVPSDTTLGMQPDMYEYICACSAAWDCPISLKADLERLRAHPRTEDNLEVLRRWEEARLARFFSMEQIEAFRDGGREHILLIDESGRFELWPYEQIQDAANGSPAVRAFVFERRQKTHIVFWHPFGEAKLEVKVDAGRVRLFRDLGKEIPIERTSGGVVTAYAGRQYLVMDLARSEALSVFRAAKVVAGKKN